MPLRGSEAPDRSNHLMLTEVGFHSDHLSTRPTSSIAEPAKGLVLIFVQGNETLDPDSLWCLRSPDIFSDIQCINVWFVSQQGKVKLNAFSKDQ